MMNIRDRQILQIALPSIIQSWWFQKKIVLV